MQRIVDFGLDVKEYVNLVSRLGVRALVIPVQFMLCPFCREPHRLWHHGSYSRFMDDGEQVHKSQILCLFCPIEGKTVSLLPHFLMPRKQATCKVMETYFTKRHIEGLPQAVAMAAATKTNPSRQKGAYWDRCLEKKAPVLMAHLRPRRTEEGALLPRLVRHLLHGFASPGEALCVHNQRLHARFSVWLF